MEKKAYNIGHRWFKFCLKNIINLYNNKKSNGEGLDCGPEKQHSAKNLELYN